MNRLAAGAAPALVVVLVAACAPSETQQGCDRECLLAVADSYMASFDARLEEEVDVVFFDQRGVGPLNGISCPKAGLVFDTTRFSRTRSLARTASVAFLLAPKL